MFVAKYYIERLLFNKQMYFKYVVINRMFIINRALTITL